MAVVHNFTVESKRRYGRTPNPTAEGVMRGDVMDFKYGINPNYSTGLTKAPRYGSQHIGFMEGDILTHVKSGRKFMITDVSGFVCYEAIMVEIGGNLSISKIKFESYYKD